MYIRFARFITYHPTHSTLYKGSQDKPKSDEYIAHLFLSVLAMLLHYIGFSVLAKHLIDKEPLLNLTYTIILIKGLAGVRQVQGKIGMRGFPGVNPIKLFWLKLHQN